MTEQTTPPETKAEAQKAVAVDDTTDTRANAITAMEEIESMTPTPTQDELDAVKRGDAQAKSTYKTRQTKA